MSDRRKHQSKQINPDFPINTIRSMRGVVGVLMKTPDQCMRYVDAMYQAMNSIHG